ncbi:MAG: NAD-dependent succinate-semialdehyde dehydrogenase [Phycisphaeraceae bacterium]
MLQSPLLQTPGGYINGKWITPRKGGKTLRVINPATGEHLATVADMTGDHATQAIDAADRAMSPASSLHNRQCWLEAIDESLRAHREELARILTLEMGKPIREARAEIDYAAGFFAHYAGEVFRLNAEELKARPKDCRWTIYHGPAGVAALITPWNFPLAMVAKKLAAGIGAGCGVVYKPARQTPLTVIALWHLLEALDLPPGLLNLVIGGSGPLGKVFCTHPAVRIVSMTGSTETGRKLMALAAPHIKKLALELGGNAPFIVFDDADLDHAADELMANKFRAGGQTCVCTNRVYAHQSVVREFTQKVALRMRQLKVGPGIEEDTDLGPLIDRAGWDKVARHVKDAMKHGAKRIVGDDPPRPRQDWGAFYPPTLLTGIKPDMVLCHEETFGPVVAIASFRDEAKVLAAANDTIHGLAAYFFTKDPDRATRVAAALRFGHVGLNTGAGPTPQAPFGGMKQSGLGREGGIEGLFEYTETQVVASR